MKSAERKATAVFGKNQLLWDLGLNPALMTRHFKRHNHTDEHMMYICDGDLCGTPQD